MKNLRKIIAVFFAAIMIMSCAVVTSQAALRKTRYSVLVLDVSGSMSGTPVEEVKASATKFCEQVLRSNRSSNQVAVVSFATSTTVVCDFTDDLTTLTESIDNLYASGSTYLAPALSTAKGMLEKVSEDDIKNILVFCDGQPFDETAAYGVVKSCPLHWNIYSFYFSQAGYSDSTANVMKNIGRNGYIDGANSGLNFDFSTEWSSNVTTNDANNVVVRIACPVDVEVVLGTQKLNKYNPQTTFGTLEITTDNNGDEIKTLNLAYNKDYSINIQGYDTGKMDYSIEYFCNDSSLYSVNYPTVNVKDGTKIGTTINVDEEKITLDIDNDGDGVIDDYVSPRTSPSNFRYRVIKFFKEFFGKIRDFFSRFFSKFKRK